MPVVRRLRAAISEHRLVATGAALAFIVVATIVSVWVFAPDKDDPSAGDQLVVTTVNPTNRPAQTGTAVVIDGELGLVALPRISDPDEVTSYMVQVPLDDGRVFDVAAVRVDVVEDVDIVQLVGTSVNPDLAAQLDTYARLGIGELDGAPDELWTYGTDAEGLPAPTRVPTSVSDDDSVSTDEQPAMAFALVVESGRLVGFGTAACTSADGTTSLRVIDASGIAGAFDDATSVSETVGPAPVPSTGVANFTPEPCTDG